LTVVIVDAVLLPGAGSATGLDTVAVLLSVPVASGVTVIVIVTESVLAKVPMVHVTVGVAKEHVPDDAPVHVADPYVTATGSVSVTVTPVAVLGPLFVTVMV
jgi:hypothetical protein